MLTAERMMELVKAFFTKFLIKPISHFEVRDAIDILLLTFVLYFIYRLIRDSRAFKLLIGFGFVFLIMIVARTFNMSGLNFIFGNLQQIGILAVLILFQPELRTALERVGETPITGVKSIASESKALAAQSAEIDAICTAVNELSREKVGALIVIERSTKLGDFIKSGVIVDAAISSHLLRNLFFNKAPLHDGAVIIRNSRVCAAGCFLPLSTKEDINKDLGTRHRAAIGITEVSDALVIVVSEETGIVSVALDGSLERNYNYATLKQALNTHVYSQGIVAKDTRDNGDIYGADYGEEEN
jgi:diadenylate cyclase